MRIDFEHFRRYPRFENRSALRVVPQLLGLANAQQVAYESGVKKVQLGGLDHALAYRRMPARNAEHEITRFEYRQPGSHGVV